AKAEGQPIDRALVDSGVLDPISARTFRTIVQGYASIDPSTIAERVDLHQARLLTPPQTVIGEGELISLEAPNSDTPTTLSHEDTKEIGESLGHLMKRLPPVPSKRIRTRETGVGPIPLGFGAPEDWLGTTLGPYTLSRFVGEGSTSRVFEVEHSVLGVRRILKLPSRGASAETLLAEARLLERLAHPGVAPFLEFDVDQGCPFAVLRYEEGQCLSDRIDAMGALSHDELLRVGRDVARVLAFCHARDVLHLDLKPANLFVSERGTIVLDFGIAAAREDVARHSHFYGTPQFAAPEQVVAPESIDERTDLYGLGMTLYASAAGSAWSEGEELFSHFFGELRPLEELRPDLDPSLCQLIAALTARGPTDRPANAEAVAAQLETLTDTLHSEELS
ncbi:MAG: serine/threonine-protein kinase, partial [Myxococcota bacterium]